MHKRYIFAFDRDTRKFILMQTYMLRIFLVKLTKLLATAWHGRFIGTNKDCHMHFAMLSLYHQLKNFLPIFHKICEFKTVEKKSMIQPNFLWLKTGRQPLYKKPISSLVLRTWGNSMSQRMFSIGYTQNHHFLLWERLLSKKK